MAANLTNRTKTASHGSVPDSEVLGFEIYKCFRPSSSPTENAKAKRERIGVSAKGRVGVEELRSSLLRSQQVRLAPAPLLSSARAGALLLTREGTLDR